MTEVKTQKFERRLYSFGPLYDLMMSRFPHHRTSQGIFDVQGFASDLNVSYETIYRAFRSDYITPKFAKSLILLSREQEGVEPLTRDDLFDFVFPEDAPAEG